MFVWATGSKDLQSTVENNGEQGDQGFTHLAMHTTWRTSAALCFEHRSISPRAATSCPVPKSRPLKQQLDGNGTPRQSVPAPPPPSPPTTPKQRPYFGDWTQAARSLGLGSWQGMWLVGLAKHRHYSLFELVVARVTVWVVRHSLSLRWWCHMRRWCCQWLYHLRWWPRWRCRWWCPGWQWRQ